MDSFYEQFISTTETRAYKITKFLIIIGVVMATIYLLLGNPYLCVLSIVLSAACFVMKKKLYVEYEYDFTNGEIDIDKIVDKKSRKRAVTFNIKDIEILAPEDSDALKSVSFKPVKIMDLYTNSEASKVYSILVNYKAEKTQVNFMPDEEFLNLCFKKNPRKVVIK